MAYIPVDWEYSLRKECIRRGYSPRTIKTYSECISKFLKFSGKTLDKIGKQDVRLYLDNLAGRGLAGSSLNVNLMAIRFLLEDILRKNIHLNIKYSKTPEKLPVVLTKEEVKRLIGKIANWKHRLMIELMYGSGLRVSELINLKVKDLEISKNYGFVRGGKGNKDRMFILPKICSEKIKSLIEIENLEKENYLFNSNRNDKYNLRSLQEIIKRASKLAGINKKVHCHTLRHSFATHLIEQGQSVSEVQSLLGHKSPETTMIYLHTSGSQMINIKSPLDNF